MPRKIRALGDLAHNITSGVHGLLEQNSDEFFQVAGLIAKGENEQAIELLTDIAHRNHISMKALFLLVNDQLHLSEQVLIDRNRSNGNHHE